MPGETIDFGALAARLSEIDGVRACLLMSRDGLTLGVHPEDREESARAVWERMHSVGDPDRGFLAVGDELWIVARRGPYAGIVVAGPSATPGLLLDRLEFSLRAAEELRLREGSATTVPRGEGARRPRPSLHPEVEVVGAGDAISAAIQIASMREGPLTRPHEGNGHANGSANGNGSKVPEGLKLKPLETEKPEPPAAEAEPDLEHDAPAAEAETEAALEAETETALEAEPEALEAEPELELQPEPENEPEPDDEPELGEAVELDLDSIPDPEVEIEIHPLPRAEDDDEGAHLPGDDREVDPVALAREFKNLFDRPDE